MPLELSPDNPVTQELVDKYPLPDGYFWFEGTSSRWPSVRKGSAYDNRLIISYRFAGKYENTLKVWKDSEPDSPDNTYKEESPEDAV